MATTFRYAIKCMGCGLHFNVYSWEEKWLQTSRLEGQPFCPECGQAKGFPLAVEKMKGEIFEYVPGALK